MIYSHNFGHNGPDKYYGLGINAKMSEIQAAMGLAVLPHMNFILESRKKVCDFYDHNLNFNKIKKIKLRDHTDWNYSYYPIIFESEKLLYKALEKLNNKDIQPRRYFYPSLEKLPYINSNRCPISKDISKRVLCLPLHTDLDISTLRLITKYLNH